MLRKALNKAFSPEFLNRVDDIVMFDQLSKEAIFRIIDIELRGFYRRVAGLGYTLTITDEAKNFIAERGYDPQFGARPLKRAIQKYVEDELAEFIIDGELHRGASITVGLDKEKGTTVISVAEVLPEGKTPAALPPAD